MRAKLVKRSMAQLSRAALFTVEKLEPRQLFSVVYFPNGTIVARTTPGNNDTILVSHTTPSILEVTFDGVPLDFVSANITKLKLIGASGNNTIRILEGNGPVTVPAFLYSGTGSSTLLGGSGHDTLAGGNGNNLVYTTSNGVANVSFGDGKNIIEGHGHDNIVVGTGNNVIDNGGSSSNIVHGGGQDLINNGGAAPAAAAAGPVNGGYPGYNAVPNGFSPAQLGFAYSLPAATATDQGAGQTIVYVTAYSDPYVYDEMATYCAQYDLPQMNTASLQVMFPDGIEPIVDPIRNFSSDIAPVVELMHASSPGARIIIVESADNGSSLDGAMRYGAGVAESLGGGIVTMGFQQQEEPDPLPPGIPVDPFFGINQAVVDAYDAIFSDPAFVNVSFIANSGDFPPSSKAGEVQFPASAENVTAVGGTTLTLNANAFRTNETAYANGNGGISGFVKSDPPPFGPVTGFGHEPVPVYQQGLGYYGRATPDLAMNADPATGYSTFSKITDPAGLFGWIQSGGTSLAGAYFSGIVANANSVRAAAGFGVIGSGLQTAVYNAGFHAPGAFNDIYTGAQGANKAAGGFDLTTGFGAPVANAFESLLSGGVPLPVPTPLAGTTNINVNSLTFSAQFDEAWNSVTGTGPSLSAYTGNGSLTGQNTLTLILNVVSSFQTNPANTPAILTFNNLSYNGTTFSGTGRATGLSATDVKGVPVTLAVDGTAIRDANGVLHISGEFYTVDALTLVRLSLNSQQAIFFGSFHG